MLWTDPKTTIRWEEDGEDKDGSDWVMDNNSFMSNGGQSDE